MAGTSNPNRPLRAAVVGARIGRKHAAGYAASDRAELVAICDAIESRCHALADQHDVEARYTDFETMLREQRPDVLSIATPQATHAPLTILAASRYAPTAILCERAMAGNLGEARAMLATCDKFSVKLAIGHQGRWLRAYEQARDAVAAGDIGTPVFARVGCSVGGITNHLTHALDRMLFMLGQPEVEWVLGNVQRESDRWERGWPSEEMAAAVVGLAGGMRLSLESETPAAPGLEAHTHLIVGTDGLLIVSQDGRGSDYAVRIVGRDGRTRDIPASGDYYDDARLRETDALAAWAAGDLDEHRGDAHLAIKTQEALMAIYESARTRTLVRLPLKTMASPLIQMIESGELPVRYPGRYDTRHHTAGYRT